jgi:hypothetical protein
LTLALGTAICALRAELDKSLFQIDIKTSILKSLKLTLGSYIIGLLFGAAAIANAWQPGTIEYVKAIAAPVTASADLDKYLPLHEEALKYPDTPMHNRARLTTIYDLSDLRNYDPLAISLCDQIINSKCENKPETSARALEWKIFLSKDKADYKTTIAPEIDRALSLLEKVKEEPNLKQYFPYSYAPNPGIPALGLATTARSFNDTERANKAISIAKKWCKGDAYISNSIERFENPKKDYGRFHRFWNRFD